MMSTEGRQGTALTTSVLQALQVEFTSCHNINPTGQDEKFHLIKASKCISGDAAPSNG